MREAAAQRAVPVFVLYAFPFNGCAANGDQGVSAAAAGYQQWIDQVAQGIGTGKAVLVVEPDALAQDLTLDCLTAGQQASRLAVLKAAVARLATLPHAAVYLDAGNARWQPVPVMARLLRAAGVLAIRGFALNVSNFDTTSAEASYGDQLSARLDNAHFIIDTSRNGAASARSGAIPPARRSACHPPPTPPIRGWMPGCGSSRRRLRRTCGGGPPAGPSGRRTRSTSPPALRGNRPCCRGLARLVKASRADLPDLDPVYSLAKLATTCECAMAAPADGVCGRVASMSSLTTM